MNALELNQVSKSFSGFTLNHISLTLPMGCIMGLVGENGAGKSTTIKLILNLIRPSHGSVSVLGQDAQGRSCSWKSDVGVVLDEVGIPACLDTRKTGRVMAGIYPNWDQNAYERYLKRMELPEKKPFSDFSKGMKMKLGIAIAMSHDPKLLILDEATSGLDPVVREEVLDIFSEFTRNPGHAVLISSHIVTDLEKICDYMAFLHKGQLLLSEEKDVLLAQYGKIQCTAEALTVLPPEAIVSQKRSPYGAEAVVRRDSVPSNMDIRPVTLEELFIAMVKEEN